MASQFSYSLGFSVREILLLKQRMPHFWEIVFYGLCSLFLFICFILFFHCIEHLFSVRKLVQFSLNIKLATLGFVAKVMQYYIPAFCFAMTLLLYCFKHS